MEKILNLFARRRGPRTPARDVRELVMPLSRPALQLVTSTETTGSFFGGDPLLPNEIEWPAKSGKPLTFLACLDLRSVAETDVAPWLPDTGRLQFFYDVDEQPWGFDPKDTGGWAVLYCTREGAVRPVPADARRLPRRYVAQRRIETFPSYQRPEITALGLRDDEADTLSEISVEAYGNQPSHQVGGFPNPIQSDDMDLQCQLVTHGLYCGDSSGYRDPRAAELSPGSQEWRLLLQIDSDDELDVMWGDVGMLYFWIKEQDARDGRFENGWTILQCH